MSTHIALWHKCKFGGGYGMWSDEPLYCLKCHQTAEIPVRRIIYDELSAPPVLVNRETFPDLRTDEYPQMGVQA